MEGTKGRHRQLSSPFSNQVLEKLAALAEANCLVFAGVCVGSGDRNRNCNADVLKQGGRKWTLKKLKNGYREAGL